MPGALGWRKDNWPGSEASHLQWLRPPGAVMRNLSQNGEGEAYTGKQGDPAVEGQSERLQKTAAREMWRSAQALQVALGPQESRICLGAAVESLREVAALGWDVQPLVFLG